MFVFFLEAQTQYQAASRLQHHPLLPDLPRDLGNHLDHVMPDARQPCKAHSQIYK